MPPPEPTPARRAAAPGERPARTRPLRVAACGGGTGLPAVLSGLAAAPGPGGVPVQVSAVVTTADDGGSSGELRRRYGVPSPGDVRNCLVALAPGSHPLADVFQHRFGGEGGLTGHTVGNVVLAALTQRLGDFSAAVEAAGRMLRARGRVLPAYHGDADLEVRLSDGRRVRGESAIAEAGGRVERLTLARSVPAGAQALHAVASADLVVLGPGSLYSSVIASLLGRGMAEALRASRALRVMVVNLFTEPGESDGHDVADHVRAVLDHAGPVVDVALVHGKPLPRALVRRYAARGARPVALAREALAGLGTALWMADLLAPGGMARHDPAKLAGALLDLWRRGVPEPAGSPAGEVVALPVPDAAHRGRRAGRAPAGARDAPPRSGTQPGPRSSAEAESMKRSNPPPKRAGSRNPVTKARSRCA